MNIRVLAFAFYSIAYEAIIWIGFGWVVFVKNHSPWWMLLAAILSAAQLKPKHFGIK